MTAPNTNNHINIIIVPDNLQIQIVSTVANAINNRIERTDPLVMRLLLHLHKNQHQVISRNDLSEQVWCSPHTSDEAINRGISRLRKILGSKRDAFIKTIPKQGYQFSVPVNVSFTISDELATPDVNDSKIEKISTPIQLEPVTPAIEQLPNTPQSENNRLRPLTFITSIFICLVLAVALWPKEQANTVAKTLDTKTQNQKSNKIPLSVKPFTRQSNAQQISNNYVLALYSQLKTELEQSHKFNFKQADNPYVIEVTIEQATKVNITVNIKNGKHNINHFAHLKFSKAQFESDSKQVINEIAAFTRLMLIYNQHDKRLLKAYKPLSYFEIEQLAHVTKGGWFIYDQLPHHYKFVTQLQQKYPDIAEISGILARLDAMRVTNLNVDVVKEKHHQLENALKALGLDPANYDGLYAAFNHNMDFPQYRAKAIDYANSMKNYYPNHSRAWRNQLRLMIDNRLSCSSINEYVNSIPKGIFKPYRLTIIKQILTACITEQSVQGLYQQLKFLPNSKSDRAIINNFNLFDVRHDNLWKQDSRSTIVFNSVSFYQLFFIHQMMRGDSSGALNFLQKLDDSQNRYWRWQSRLYFSLYESDTLSDVQVEALAQDAQQQEHDLWRDDYVSILQENAELFFAAYMIKHSKNPFNQQRIQYYLSERPSFPINIINRQESLAKIMLLHIAGQTTQAASVANQLYKQLEQNYQASPSSFRFWNLGSFHLLAKLYCGQNCGANEVEPQQYLNKMFSQHHIWWLDDYQVMQQALKPWKDSDIVDIYLQKIEEDLKRIKK